MKKIIITGTDGFVGKNLKNKLSDSFEIIEINESVFKSVDWYDEVSKLFWLDITAVFHVGACSNTLEQDVNYMMLVNYEFTKHLSLSPYPPRVTLLFNGKIMYNYFAEGELDKKKIKSL